MSEEATTGRAWKCAACGCEARIPDSVPADANIVCPSCKREQLPSPAKRTKVAIVGFADSWPEAPFHNPDWEIWCLNQFYDLTGAKVDYKKLAAEKRLVWFDLHRRYDLENDPNVIARHPHHLQKLREMPCPVWMHRHWDDVPNSREYPLAAMTAKFGGYWTNSISYMIALAISQGFKEMGLYGINMAQDTEWAFQRPSCEYMVGWARAAGITVHIPPQSDLLKAPYLYGYEDDKANATLAKLEELIKEHTAKLAHHQRVADENTAYAQQFNGAIQQLQATKRMFTIGR